MHYVRSIFYVFFLITILGSTPAVLADYPYPDCSVDTDATTLINSGWYECQRDTPDQMQISVYRLALCTSKPTFSDFNSDSRVCDYIIDLPTQGQPAEDISVGETETIDLDKKIVPILPKRNKPVVYTHGALLFSNVIGVKASVDFTNPQYDGMGRRGSKCWTNGKPNIEEAGYSGPADYPMTCGDDEDPNSAFSLGTVEVMSDGSSYLTTILNQTSGSDRLWDATLLSDYATEQTPATEAVIYFDSGGSPRSDARYIWSVEAFNSQIRYDPSVEYDLDIGVGVKKGMHLEFSSWCGSSLHCIKDASIAGFDVKITIKEN